MTSTDQKFLRGAKPRKGETKKAARTCVACKQTTSREALVRLCLGPELELFVDLRGKLPGKGVWIHSADACVSRLEKSPGILHRGLGSTPSTEKLRVDLTQMIRFAVRDGLSMAAASGALVGGKRLLEKAIKNGSVRHVVFASDASERTVSEFLGLPSEDLISVQLTLNRDALGAAIGKGERAALGIRSCRGSMHLIRQLRRLRGLG